MFKIQVRSEIEPFPIYFGSPTPSLFPASDITIVHLLSRFLSISQDPPSLTYLPKLFDHSTNPVAISPQKFPLLHTQNPKMPEGSTGAPRSGGQAQALVLPSPCPTPFLPPPTSSNYHSPPVLLFKRSRPPLSVLFLSSSFSPFNLTRSPFFLSLHSRNEI